MTGHPPNPPRKSRVPLLDTLGQLCTDGKATAEYLWQVPDDTGVRLKLVGLLDQIAGESAKQGRKEMGRICAELSPAAKASPSPQQVELLVDGFDRLFKLWQAAKSGLL
ncbi:MAG TPA: hypothetical protein VNX15_08135 [Gemmatimonadales bacterium]|nr:hypothetical protein [Gemmatimonadales bacterium]